MDSKQLEARRPGHVQPDCRQAVTLARNSVHFSWIQSNAEGAWFQAESTFIWIQSDTEGTSLIVRCCQTITNVLLVPQEVLKKCASKTMCMWRKQPAKMYCDECLAIASAC